MINNLKKIYNDKGQWERSLYFHQIPLNDLFSELREIDISDRKEKQQEGEYFLSLKAESGRHYYYVKASNGLADWIKDNTFSDLRGRSFEVIQQRSGKEFLDQWLVLLSESQIIASYWFDYKTTDEIRELFKGDL